MLRRAYFKILSRFYPQTFLKKVGVKIGKGTRVMGSLYRIFSEEAYLITIGENCLLSSEVTLLTHDGSVDVFRREFPRADRIKPIVIGDNVFIGHRSIIMPGVTIGSNVVIGAGSVVNKDVPSDCVYAGVPAKFIKTIGEYKEKIVSEMLETKHLNEEDKRAFLINHYSKI
jgi:acetyltransferase-like isoleucine patch superfamily enzyme